MEKKNILKALTLSKDRECYKEIEKLKVELPSPNKDKEENSANNLPIKQNRFLRFLAKVRAYFPDQKNTDEGNYSKRPQNKKRKWWGLGIEEKNKIQNETSIIAKKYCVQQKENTHDKHDEKIKQIEM